MATDLAARLDMSPSKLLLPLSYAAILGGTLTLIGTSTNLIASEFAVEFLGRRPIGMFEFTALGAVIVLVGITYLLRVGYWLTPARIPPDGDLVAEFDLMDHLTCVRVGADGFPSGRTIPELESAYNIRILQRRHAAPSVAPERDQRSELPERVPQPDGGHSDDGIRRPEDGDM